ncbi:MAG: hypothetical protein K0R26_1919 [Bacteroidota bacterium]|jgi:hypothetical protein|nr:hypothetical protein [Bacteroidota bacterium]
MSCYKRGYTSEREAREVLNSVKTYRIQDKYSNTRRNKLIGKKDKRPKRTYRCPECDLFHLTSEPKKYKNEKRAKY